jgi:Tol biopolymer transport system component
MTPHPFPKDQGQRYPCLNAVSRSGDRVVFIDSMRSDIFVRHLHGTTTETNLTNDRHSDLDPAWSPDEQLIIYVSDRPDSPEMR